MLQSMIKGISIVKPTMMATSYNAARFFATPTPLESSVYYIDPYDIKVLEKQVLLDGHKEALKPFRYSNSLDKTSKTLELILGNPPKTLSPNGSWGYCLSLTEADKNKIEKITNSALTKFNFDSVSGATENKC